MKKAVKILIPGMALLLGVTFTQAQSITKEYSDAQIEQMMMKYKSSNSHDVVPSAAIVQKFNADFSNAQNIEWEAANDIYEVEFDVKRDEYTAYYDNKGSLIGYSKKIHKADLPEIVKRAAEGRHSQYRFKDIKKVYQGSMTYYKVEMERGDMDVKMKIREDGTFIN